MRYDRGDRPTGAAARAAFPLSTAQTDGRTHSLDPLPQSLFSLSLSLSLSRGFKPHLHAAVLQLACEVAYRVPIAAAAGGGGDGETDGDFPKVDKRPERTGGRTAARGAAAGAGGCVESTDATDGRTDEGSAHTHTHTLT